MTFIFRKTPTGVCIFELHSSQLPSTASPDEDPAKPEHMSSAAHQGLPVTVILVVLFLSLVKPRE